MPDEAEPQPWFDLYWHAWDALRFDRHYGAMGGEMPIPYQAISSFARDRGLSGDDFWTFHRLLTAIDAEWLDHVASERKKGGDK